MLNGLFDIDNRLDYLTENGDMLPRLKELELWDLQPTDAYVCKINEQIIKRILENTIFDAIVT